MPTEDSVPEPQAAGNNADNWRNAVSMLTGYPVPDRSTVFAGVKGNDEIPLMHVRLAKVGGSEAEGGFQSNVNAGWGKSNTHYTIPFYAPQGDFKSGGVVPAGQKLDKWRAYITFLGHVVGSPDRGWISVEGETESNPLLTTTGLLNESGSTPTAIKWDTMDLARYIHGSVDALNTLLNTGTTHHYKNRGRNVEDHTYVHLHSFIKTARAFEAAVMFFEEGARTIGGWDTVKIGEGGDGWDGTAAAIFKRLVHKLARNYEGYSEQVNGAGSWPAGNAYRSDPARALFTLRDTLNTQAENLVTAWGTWMGFSGERNGHPHEVLYNMLEEVRNSLIKTEIDFTVSKTESYHSDGKYAEIVHTSYKVDTVAGSGFLYDIVVDGKNYGSPGNSDTWVKIGEEAIRRWEEFAQNTLAVAGSNAIFAIQNAFFDAQKSFDTKITDKDTKSLAEIAMKEEADATKKEAAAKAAEVERENKRLAAQAAADRLKLQEQAAADRKQAEADRAEAKRLAAEDRARLEADRAEAKRIADEARALAAQDRIDAEALAAAEKAEAKAEQNAAKAAAAAEKAEIKAQNELDRAEAKRAQEEAKQRAIEQQAQALALAERQRAEAKKERDEAKAEQAAEKAEAEQKRDEAEARNEQDRAEAKARNEEDRAEAKRAQEEAKQQAVAERAVAQQEQAQAKAQREAAQQESARQAAAARQEYEQTRAEAEQRAEQGRTEAQREYDRQIAAGVDKDVAREEYDRQIAEIDATERETLQEARRDAGVGQGGTGRSDISDLIQQRLAELPQPPDLSSYHPSGATAGSAYSAVFADNLYNQDDLATALGRPDGTGADSSGGSGGGSGMPMMPPMARGAGGESGGTSERTRNVFDPAVGRSGRVVNAAQTVQGEEHRVVPGATQTSSNTPFMPPMAGGMGGGGNSGQQTQSSDRERTTWLSEDEDVWGTDEGGAPQALGR